MRVFGTRLLCAALLLSGLAAVSSSPVAGQEAGDQPVFRSSVDLVSVAAVVRDKRGKVMRSLTREDFRLIDAGQQRPFVDFRTSDDASASVMLLVDGSGSMMGPAYGASRRVAERLLSRLTPQRDEAALMSFDTRLITVRSFTGDFDLIRRGFSDLDAFGASSVYDAIAGTAGIVADRIGKRRAIVVITDGDDNASSYSADEVASIASAIDVPVYVFAVGHDAVRVNDHSARMASRATPLVQLAQATGGEFFYAAERAEQDEAVARVIDDLRHQYLLAFEPSVFGGLRRIEIRTRNSDLRVTSRQWYTAAVPQ
jgi:Ca-activated chloride channel family protein